MWVGREAADDEIEASRKRLAETDTAQAGGGPGG
jgi:hypothetical protein